MAKRAKQIILVSGILLASILAFFGKDTFPSNGSFIGGLDIEGFHIWVILFIKEQFLSGNIPLWNSHYYCGHPFLANPGNFVFCPSVFLFLVFPLPWAFNIYTLLHLFLAAMGMFCFVHILSQSKSAGLAAAIVYSLSGYNMDGIFAGHMIKLSTMAVLPWIFYFIEKTFRTQHAFFLIISGIVFGLQILCGGPGTNLYTALFATLFFIIRFFSSVKPINFKKVLQFGLPFLSIPILAFGVSAVQILPSLEFSMLSDRAKNTYEFCTYGSFPPENLFTFLVPKPKVPVSVINTNYEFGGYLGILSIVIAGIGGIFSKRRKDTFCFGVMLLIAVTLMLGRHTPVYEFYYNWLPGISSFRVPARCILIFVFCMSIFVGYGVQHLCDLQLTKKQHIAVMVGLGLLLLCVIFGAKSLHIDFSSNEIILAISLLFGAIFVLNLIRSLKHRHIITGIIIVTIFIDLYLVYKPQIPTLNQDNLLKKRNYEFLFEHDTGFYRVALPRDSLRGIRFHYSCLSGDTNIAISDYYRFVHEMANLPMPERNRQTLNPNLFLSNLALTSRILGAKYAMILTPSGYKMIGTKNIMPRAVMVRESVILPHEKQITYIKRPDFDPQTTVLLETALPDHKLPVLERETVSRGNDIVSITEYQQNRIELQSDSETNTFLVLSELFYPGWHAYVDGDEVPILRADYILRAIPLKSGHHDIVFEFKPFSFLMGATISVFTLLISGIGCFIYLVRKRG